jgi:hypothetical protein
LVERVAASVLENLAIQVVVAEEFKHITSPTAFVTMSIHRVLRSIDPEVETEHFEAQIGSHDFLEMNISVKGMEMS